MTDTLTPTHTARAVRPYGVATAVAGVAIAVLGIVGAVSPDLVGAAWYAAVVPAALLFAAGLLGLRRLATGLGSSGLVTGALAVAAVGTTLFALAHAYALVDEDTGVMLFSVFMVLLAGSLVVAAVGMFRGTAPLPRWATLVAGVWPLATIPGGGAISDLALFCAIAVWGLTWVVLGATMIRAARR
jgi:hypothetical protein